mgnify:CR=1 FL=1
MRNRYPGPCYRCAGWVEAGAGHFERLGRVWRVQHAECAIQFRGVRDEARERQCEADQVHRARRDERLAQGTGIKAQRARRRIRDRQQQEGSPHA